MDMNALFSAADPLKDHKGPVIRDPKGTVDQATINGIKSQFDYIREYVNSKKHKERLSRIVNTERNLQNSANPTQRFNSELLSEFNTGARTPEIINSLVNSNNSNLNDVSNKISVAPYDLGRNIAGVYDSSIGDVRLNNTLIKENPTVPVHEFSHSALDGNSPFSTQFRDKYISPLFKQPGTPGWDPTVHKPSELKARVDAVRFLMKKNGIVDSGTSDITTEHINKLKSIKGIENDFNYKQINDQLKEDKKSNNLLWLLNNIAKVESLDLKNGINA